MTEPVLDIAHLETLPPEWPADLLPAIRADLARSSYKIAVLDDDPTGTQTVRDLPVLTRWSVEALAAELGSAHPAFFVLTNSRSLTEERACALASEIGASLRQASERTGIRTLVISRSDSTLRGHFPAEVDACARALGTEELPYLVIPFFLEGGRYTIDDVHYVREGDILVPAAQTPFARDAAFGFSHSNLRAYIEEKTGGSVRAADVVSVSLEDIRRGGPELVAARFRAVEPRSACIINAVSYRDMEVVVAALIAVEQEGHEFLYRTAASFVRSRTGLDEGAGLLPGRELADGGAAGGLFVIGSYVPKTSAQVERLLEDTDIEPIEAAVSALLDDGGSDAEIERIAAAATAALAAGRDVVVYTSRELVTGSDGASSLAIGRRVSASLVEIVRSIAVKPRYLVGKGGVTASDIATEALGIRRAMVRGQALPGVPAWRCGEETRYPGMTYIIFPGNVGADDALVELQRKLS